MSEETTHFRQFFLSLFRVTQLVETLQENRVIQLHSVNNEQIAFVDCTYAFLVVSCLLSPAK